MVKSVYSMLPLYFKHAIFVITEDDSFYSGTITAPDNDVIQREIMLTNCKH